jgi:hypothetical protein
MTAIARVARAGVDGLYPKVDFDFDFHTDVSGAGVLLGVGGMRGMPSGCAGRVG